MHANEIQPYVDIVVAKSFFASENRVCMQDLRYFRSHCTVGAFMCISGVLIIYASLQNQGFAAEMHAKKIYICYLRIGIQGQMIS